MSVCPSVRMNAEILETITVRVLGFLGFLRSASLFQQDATPTLTPTNDYNSKTRLALTFFLVLCKNVYKRFFIL